MSKQINKNKQVCVRISSALHERLTTYAKTHELSLTDTVVSLLEKGLEANTVNVATKQDIELLMSKQEAANLAIVQAIKSQPIAVQQSLPEPTEKPQSPNPITRWWKGRNKA